MPKESTMSINSVYVKRLQRELREIAQPFINMISEAYSYSLPTIIVRPGSAEPPKVIYPPETEALVQKYRDLMNEAIQSHVAKFEERP